MGPPPLSSWWRSHRKSHSKRRYARSEGIAEGIRHLNYKDDHALNETEWIVYDDLYAYCQAMVGQESRTTTSNDRAGAMQVGRQHSMRSQALLLYVVGGVRGFGDGFAIIICPPICPLPGPSSEAIGVIVGAALFGTAVWTLSIGLIAPRHDLRNLPIGGALLMAATGLACPNVDRFAFIAMVAFIGTINPSTGDLGILAPLCYC